MSHSRITRTALAAITAVTLFSACGGSNPPAPAETTAAEATTTEATTADATTADAVTEAETTSAELPADIPADAEVILPSGEPEVLPSVEALRVITDQAGEEVYIPTEIHRVVISSIFPVPSVFCLFRDSGAEVVGMHPQAMAAAKDSLLAELYPEILDADTGFAAGGEINPESILALEPDIVIYSAANPDERAIYENAGLTPVAFSPSYAGFDCVETYASWNELLGQIFDEPDRAAGLADDARALAEKVKAVTATIPEEDKPSVLILFNYDNGVIKAAGSGSFGQYWIEQGGGINAAAELKGHADVTMEQIYEWDPDVILLSNFVNLTPEEFMNDTAFDWSPVKAVKDGKVYKYPLGVYRWYPASSDSALSLEWTAKTLQPDVFADFDLDADVKEYYKNNYGIELTDEQLAAIYK